MQLILVECFRQRVVMLCSVASDINKLLLSIMYLTVLRVRTQFVITVYLKSLMIYELLFELRILRDNVIMLSFYQILSFITVSFDI